MPLIQNSDLPTFARLQAEGQEVLSLDRARHQDIRELHIGILNIMPDAALEATERQFMRLVGSCNRIAQFHIHLFSIPEMPRGAVAKARIDRYYECFSDLQHEGLDALILSGANPVQARIEEEPFWQPLLEVVDWAREHTCSVMCSCLATHAVVQHLWGIHRYALADKRWGVYSNRIRHPHPLVANINTRFDAPHSHVYEVNKEQLAEKGLITLASSEEADMHLAVSPDGLRFVFFQGHPEYDAVSLLKEYKREVIRYIEGVRNQYPRFPNTTSPPKLVAFWRHTSRKLNGPREVTPSCRLFPRTSCQPWWITPGPIRQGHREQLAGFGVQCGGPTQRPDIYGRSRSGRSAESPKP